MIRLVLFLLRTSRVIRFSRYSVALGLVTGLLSGVGYTMLLVLVSSALADDRGTVLLASFVGLCLFVSLTRLVSQGLFEKIGVRTVFDVRLQLCRQILDTPLRKLEEVGPNRLLAALSDDVTAISTALTQLPRVCMNLAITLACLGYMAWLSRPFFFGIVGFMVVGIATYQIPLVKANRLFVGIREERDSLLALFRDIIFGAKELRLQRGRRHRLFERELVPVGRSIQHQVLVSNVLFFAAGLWGNLLFFIAIGLVLFLPSGRVEARVVTGYTLTLLYMLAPLEAFLLALPHFGRAAVAVRKLDRLGLDLTASGKTGTGDLQASGDWRTLDLVDVAYAYGDGGAESFGVGPVRLSLRPGELVFVIGGNGSGKTTLAKLLTGLYAPDRGEILVDGRPVTDENRDGYRQMFSAIFADFHLFRSLLGFSGEQLDEVARRYLDHLQLTHKVTVEGGRLSTLDLSQGQRKRLALLNAYLEDRPIYFFDEWAADQDPEYKAIFYFEILPALKASGKLVVVVSHDDRYFGVADRLIKLNNGVVEWDQAPRPMPSAPIETASWPRR